jgi:hypothetical protein
MVGGYVAFPGEGDPAGAMQQKRQFYLELKRHCADKGYRPGWTARMYEERFGCRPPDRAVELRPAENVSVVVRDWLKERNRNHFKQKNAREKLNRAADRNRKAPPARGGREAPQS